MVNRWVNSRRRMVTNVGVEVASVTATSHVVAGAVRMAVRTTVALTILVILVVTDATTVMIASLVEGTNVSQTTSPMIVREINTETVGTRTTVATTRIATEVVVVARAEVVMALTHRPARTCLLYTSPSPRDRTRSRMPSSA